MIWLLRIPAILAVGSVGLAVGLAGIPMLLLSRRSGAVHLGAQIIRSTERLARRADGVFVYLIQDKQAATKIGISADPLQRVATLQTGHPEPLSLYRTVHCRSAADARAVERDLHHYFETERMNGEWFDLDHRQLRRAVRLARRWR